MKTPLKQKPSARSVSPRVSRVARVAHSSCDVRTTLREANVSKGASNSWRAREANSKFSSPSASSVFSVVKILLPRSVRHSISSFRHSKMPPSFFVPSCLCVSSPSKIENIFVHSRSHSVHAISRYFTLFCRGGRGHRLLGVSRRLQTSGGTRLRVPLYPFENRKSEISPFTLCSRYFILRSRYFTLFYAISRYFFGGEGAYCGFDLLRTLRLLLFRNSTFAPRFAQRTLVTGETPRIAKRSSKNDEHHGGGPYRDAVRHYCCPDFGTPDSTRRSKRADHQVSAFIPHHLCRSTIYHSSFEIRNSTLPCQTHGSTQWITQNTRQTHARHTPDTPKNTRNTP